MFYCNKCADKKGWPKNTISGSYGPCECCGRVSECDDVPSYALPIPKKQMMTKKDYVAVAAIIRHMMIEERGDRDTLINVATELALHFRTDNERFSFTKFIMACGLGEPTDDGRDSIRVV